jgi:hypothetical protein
MIAAAERAAAGAVGALSHPELLKRSEPANLQ